MAVSDGTDELISALTESRGNSEAAVSLVFLLSFVSDVSEVKKPHLASSFSDESSDWLSSREQRVHKRWRFAACLLSQRGHASSW